MDLAEAVAGEDRGAAEREPTLHRERVPTDPWGNGYIYISPGLRSKDYDLTSLGKDSLTKS